MSPHIAGLVIKSMLDLHKDFSDREREALVIASNTLRANTDLPRTKRSSFHADS